MNDAAISGEDRKFRFYSSISCQTAAGENCELAQSTVQVGHAAKAARIQDLPQMIAFRNQLIHGYATINPHTVWNIAQNALPVLLATVQILLDEPGT